MNTPVSKGKAHGWLGAWHLSKYEWQAMLMAAVAFMMVLGSYYVIRPVRDQLAAATGSMQLWKFWLAAAVVMLFLTPAFGWVVSRFNRNRFVPLVYGFFALCLLGFMPLFHMQDSIGAARLGTVFYVFVSVYSLFVVSLFWSIAADVFDAEQAKRLFPLVAFGGTIGALIGPVLTKTLVTWLGVPPLLLVSAGMLGLATVLILLLMRTQVAKAAAAQSSEAESKPMGGDVWAGLKQLVQTDFLAYMALALVCLDGIGTVIYALMADYVGAHYPDRESRTAFYAQLDLWTNLLQVVLQLLITRFVLVRYGAGKALFAIGVLNMLLFTGMAVLGGGMLAVLQVATRGIGYGLGKPASDSLYARAPRDMRYKGKNVIDTLVWRMGDVLIAGLWTLAKSLGVGLPVIALTCAASGLVSGWLGWKASRSNVLEPDGRANQVPEQP